MASHEQTIQPNRARRTKNSLMASLALLAVSGGLATAAKANTSKEGRANAPAATKSHEDYHANERGLRVLNRHPKILNLIIDFPYKFGGFPFYMDPYRVLRTSGPPNHSKHEEATWDHPQIGKFNGKCWLMVRDNRNASAFGYDQQQTLDSTAAMFWLPVDELPKGAVLYPGYIPGGKHIVKPHKVHVPETQQNRGDFSQRAPGDYWQIKGLPYPYMSSVTWHNERGFMKNDLGGKPLANQDIEDFVGNC